MLSVPNIALFHLVISIVPFVNSGSESIFGWLALKNIYICEGAFESKVANHQSLFVECFWFVKREKQNFASLEETSPKFLELDKIKVKGKDELITIYKPVN